MWGGGYARPLVELSDATWFNSETEDQKLVYAIYPDIEVADMVYAKQMVDQRRFAAIKAEQLMYKKRKEMMDAQAKSIDDYIQKRLDLVAEHEEMKKKQEHDRMMLLMQRLKAKMALRAQAQLKLQNELNPPLVGASETVRVEGDVEVKP